MNTHDSHSPKMENVDLNEIDKFSQLAHKWWDKNSEFKPLHDINPLRLAFIKQQVNLTDKTILDVGCGGGILTESLAKSGAIVTGIDMADKSIKIAKLHAIEEKVANVNYQLISVENFAKENPIHFDVITCMEMLEHVPNPASIIASCATMLKPNGWLFLSTINRNTKSYLEAIIAAEYILKLVPKKTHNHKKFITPAELGRLCREANLDWIEAKGFTYNLLNKTYHLTDNLDVNYIIACQKR